MHHDPTPVRLWALRHGESRANAEGVIVSRPGRRAFEWAGLTELGRAQAAKTATAHPLGPRAVVISSDFARALQTAQIVAKTWGTAAPAIDARLRERDFGSLEGERAERYAEVWDADARGEGWASGVEHPDAVARRTADTVRELLDGSHPALPPTEGRTPLDVVLVAHGDVLQILQAWMSGHPASWHRTLPHLGNAELRALQEIRGVPSPH